MIRLIVTLLLLGLSPAGVRADSAAEIRAVYQRFAAAQNARDVARIGAFFIDGPEFLWVSDGKSFWRREAVLARMNRLAFLVSILFTRAAEDWRIASLLTTAAKP